MRPLIFVEAKFFLLIVFFIYTQNLWANRISEDFLDSIKQEVSQDYDLNQFYNTFQKVLDENKPVELLEFITPWIKTEKTLLKEKAPHLWAYLHIQAAQSYETLENTNHPSNFEQAINHYLFALQIVNREAFPQDWAMIKVNLSSAYRKTTQGIKAENLEQAIENSHDALHIYTYEEFPLGWAKAHNNLSIAYSYRTNGESRNNMEHAIQHALSALRIYTIKTFPRDWARTHVNLSHYYVKRIHGDKSENIEQALTYGQMALQIYTHDLTPEEWANAHEKLASAYFIRINGEVKDNIELAIKHSRLALEIFTREAFPRRWAWNQSTLAECFQKRIEGDKADNLEQAIAHHQLTLQVYVFDSTPEDWAWTHDMLARAFRKRIKGDKADNLEQAIAHHQLTLQVYTRETKPDDWAKSQASLGHIYREHIKGEKANNLKLAIEHYQLSLEIRTQEQFPQDWARIQKNLAHTYYSFNQIENHYDLAIKHYNLALQVYTKKSYPQDWADIQNWLGNVFYRTQGDKLENLEKAVSHFKHALEGYPPETYPQDWARIQKKLADIHYHQDNYDLAIKHYNLALQVYTKESYPQDWVKIQMSLAKTYDYSDQIEDHYDLAITHYNLALQVYTKESYPREWANIHKELGETWFYNYRSDRTNKYEQIINHFEQALLVNTYDENPLEWANLHFMLAGMYAERILGKKEDNLEQAEKHSNLALNFFTSKDYPERWIGIKTIQLMINITSVINREMSPYFFSNLNFLAKKGNNAFEEEINQTNKPEQIINNLQELMPVFTREDFPEEWARIRVALGFAYSTRLQGDRTENEKKAFSYFLESLQIFTKEKDPSMWARIHGFALLFKRSTPDAQFLRDAHSALEIPQAELDPETSFLLSSAVASSYLTKEDYDTALNLFLETLKTHEEHLRLFSYLPDTRKSLITRTKFLFPRAIWAAIKSQKYPRALELLESSRGQFLHHNLMLDIVQINRQPTTIQDEIKELQKTISDREISWRQHKNKFSPVERTNLSNELIGLHHRLQEMLRSIGINQQAPSIDMLLEWVANMPKGSAIIAPVYGELATVVFILPAGLQTLDQSHILLIPSFTNNDLQNLRLGDERNHWNGYLRAYLNWVQENDKTIRLQRRIEWQKQLTSSLEKLSKDFISPLLLHFEKLGIQPGADLFWISDAESGLFPIQAAIVEGQPFLKQYTLQFFPSINAASISQQRLSEGYNNHLLTIPDPTQDLVYAQFESELIGSLFPAKTTIEPNKGNLTQLSSALENNTSAYLHFATHGKFQWQDPLESGLVLANGEQFKLSYLLSKSQLLKGNRLVVLSACETGIADASIPGEVFGMSYAFMKAGAPGVISTLWTVNDLSTAFLIGRFFQLHREQNLEPPKALAQAQDWLRTVTNRELRNWLSQHLAKVIKSHSSLNLTKILTKLRTKAANNPDQKPYEEPYYWAGFVYSGM